VHHRRGTAAGHLATTQALDLRSMREHVVQFALVSGTLGTIRAFAYEHNGHRWVGEALSGRVDPGTPRVPERLDVSGGNNDEPLPLQDFKARRAHHAPRHRPTDFVFRSTVQNVLRGTGPIYIQEVGFSQLPRCTVGLGVSPLPLSFCCQRPTVQLG